MDDDGKSGEQSDDRFGRTPGVAGDRVRCESPNACVDEVSADARARGGESYSRCACTKLPGSECNGESGECRSDIELRAASEISESVHRRQCAL